MERARSDMLRLAGIDQRAAMEAGDGSWAVTDLAIKYLSPAKLDDDLLVVSTVEAVRGASVVIAQRILRGAETLTDGRVTAAFLSPKGRPRRPPAGWADRFTAIMRSAERRGGKACVRTCRSRWSTHHKKNKTIETQHNCSKLKDEK